MVSGCGVWGFRVELSSLEFLGCVSEPCIVHMLGHMNGVRKV